MAKDKTGDNINLNDLKSIDFGPNWLNESGTKQNHKIESTKYKKSENISKKRKNTNKFDHSKKPSHFTLKISCGREILEELKKQIKKSLISFSISEISDTLSKKENFLLFKLEYQKTDSYFYIDQSTDKIYENLELAIHRIIKDKNNKFISSKLSQGNKPNGNFSSVSVCPKTSHILPPKSYHDFEKIVKDHLFSHAIETEYQIFVNKLETTSEKTKVEEWTEKPIHFIEYTLTDLKGKINTYNSIDPIIAELNKQNKNSVIRKSSTISLKGSELNRVSTSIQNIIKYTLEKTNHWKKDIFTQSIIFLKKNGMHIFKHPINKNFHVAVAKPKSINDNSISKNSLKIIKVIEKSPMTKKVELFKISKELNLDKTVILRELKWLLHEGYLREFSNGEIIFS